MAANTSQEVRIIGGKWKGRKLRFAGDASLRPTAGRVRETLFNWLRPYIAGQRCLDLFAGSGALGFEALSQGAACCHFVDANPRTIRALQDNAAQLEANEHARISRHDALRWLTRGEPVDIAFLDPPFDRPELLNRALELIQQRNLVTGFVYLEARDPALLSTASKRWPTAHQKTTRAGDAHAVLLSLD